MTIVDDFSYDAYGVLLQKDSVASNDPGYTPAQETTVEYNASDVETSRTRIQYTIGDDVISQTESTSTNGGSSWTASDTQYLLYDGHGSTRQLADHTLDLGAGLGHDGSTCSNATG